MMVTIQYKDAGGRQHTAKAQPLARFTLLDSTGKQRECLHCHKPHTDKPRSFRWLWDNNIFLRWLNVQGVGIRWAHETCMAGLEGRGKTRGLLYSASFTGKIGKR